MLEQLSPLDMRTTEILWKGDYNDEEVEKLCRCNPDKKYVLVSWIPPDGEDPNNEH